MMSEFSPFELKSLRRSIGASLSRMAQLIGLKGGNAADSVRQMENGNKPVSEPIQRLLKYMQTGIGFGEMDKYLPEFMLASDLSNKIESEWVFHTRYPRFLAIVHSEPISGVVSSSVDGLEWLNVSIWIDEPVSDPQELVDQAANHLYQFTKDS